MNIENLIGRFVKSKSFIYTPMLLRIDKGTVFYVKNVEFINERHIKYRFVVIDKDLMETGVLCLSLESAQEMFEIID